MSFSVRQFIVPTIEDIQLKGKRVFLRLDLNVPMKDGKVLDDSRIRASLPTIQYCLEQGAHLVISSHLGRPKGKHKEQYSLLPAAEKLSELLDRSISFVDDCVGDGPRRLLMDAKPIDVLVLENLRFHHGEKTSEEKFAHMLHHNCDVYINDAFGVLHREDASVKLLPNLFKEKGVGFLVEKEIKALSRLLESPEKPYALILGGSKVSDKIKLIETMIPRIDMLFIGGAMAFTFLKAEGYNTGDSLLEEDMLQYAQKLLDMARQKNVQIFLPKDFQIAKDIDGLDARINSESSVPDSWMGLDIGPKTQSYFSDYLQRAKTVFWNGPMGMYETSPFDEGTYHIAKALAELKAYKVIGGGDSAAATVQAGFEEQMSHVSMGGGASLAFLSGKVLPGLKSLFQVS